MEVEVLRSTDKPEKLVCQAARGDYYEGYIGDTDYAELMKNVDHKEKHLESVIDDESDFIGTLHETHPKMAEVKTAAFIEKQLSRGHYGPFEAPQISFAIKGVPVFTERQLIRHRHLTFDVQSMRYADFSDAPYTIPETLTDATLNREDGYTELNQETREECLEIYTEHMDASFEKYKKIVDNGVPKEDARALLGLGTEVNLTVSGNARSFLHLLNMRDGAASQWNIRQLSELLLDELFEWMPYTYQWYDNNRPHKLSP